MTSYAPYEAAKLKVERGKRHVESLVRVMNGIALQSRPEMVIEPDGDTGRELLVVKSDMPPTPPDVSLIAGDAIHCFSAALDYAMSEFTKNVRGIDLKRIGFPFQETRDKLVESFSNTHLKHLPPGVCDFFVNQIKPYRCGNTALWTLRRLDNINKHRLPITVFGVAALVECSMRDSNGNVWIGQSVGVKFGGRTNAISNTAKMKIIDKGNPKIDIFINEPGLLEGAPILPVLRAYGDLTLRVIASVEAFYADMMAVKPRL